MISRTACVMLAAVRRLHCRHAGQAACQRLAFLVNDYGKDGPTKDAKDLLDKYIVTWTKEKGIAKYTVGKKDVKCELFLNFIVFDEHTCEASAMVCWGGRKGHRQRPPRVRRRQRLQRPGRPRPRRRKCPAEIQLRSQGIQPLTI